MSCPAHALAASRRFLLIADVDLIQQIVRELPRDRLVRVLDIGAGSGTTALSVFAERPTAVVVVSVDTSAEALASTGQAVTNIGRREDWSPYLDDGQAIDWLLFGGKEWDLLLIDSDHSREGVRSAVRTWLPYLREGAPAWFHDYESAVGVIPGTEAYPGVAEAVDALVLAGVLEGEAVKGGLGIAYRKPACPTCHGLGVAGAGPDLGGTTVTLSFCACPLGAFLGAPLAAPPVEKPARKPRAPRARK